MGRKSVAKVKMTRVQINLGPKSLEMLSEIMEKLEVGSMAETFRYLIREYHARMKNCPSKEVA